MKKTRRVFLTQLTVLTGSAAVSKPLSAAAKTLNQHNLLSADSSVTVYHTNDLNGQIDPVYKGLGGLAQFKSRLQNDGKKGLLLDAGGFMSDCRDHHAQIKLIGLMNVMGYRAAGVGSREFSVGQDNLAALAGAMQFKLVNCNHGFKGNLGAIVLPYTIIKYNNLKIGITGVSRRLKGVKYADPVSSANRVAALLKKQEGCYMVICLSQLGNSKKSASLNDTMLGAQTEHIDLIIGSDTSSCGKTWAFKNAADAEVVLATAGHKCLTAGRLIFNFDKAGEKRFINGEQWVSGAPANQHASIAIPNLEKIKDKLILV